MCGISALFSFSSTELDKNTLIAMTNTVSHRGPDGEGYVAWKSGSGEEISFGGPTTSEEVYQSPYEWRPVRLPENENFSILHGLGHRRLSIVDLSPGGHQPMKSVTDHISIVFNGEIYNYEEIRESLKKEGYHFSTSSDTEVILNAWRYWGKDCLQRFNGMFAILIFDSANQRVFAARDRYGEKPLYYWVSRGGFIAFASEIKQFTILPGWKARLNAQRAYDFLNFSISDHTSETLFADVFQLRGGECIDCTIQELRTPAMQIRKWYQIRPANISSCYKEACDEFAEIFTDSVNLRRHADVAVGTSLSGGMDSSSIICTVNELKKKYGGEKNKTFTACSADARFDERHYAESVIKHTDCESHFTYPALQDFLQDFRKIIWHHDEPIAGASIFAEWEVFKLVATTPVKVTLEGHGSDEMLGGYHSFFKPFFAESFSKGNWSHLLSEASEARTRHYYNHAFMVKCLLDVYAPDFIKQFVNARSGRVTARANWFETKSLGVEEYNLNNKLGGKTSSFQTFSKVQLLYSSLPQQLKWCDRDSMAHGIESRAPFLDHRIVEYSLACDTRFKMKKATTKKILRDAMADRMPHEIITRQDKMGFVTPEYAWIREDAPEIFIELVKKAVKRTEGILTPLAEKKAIDTILGKRPFDLFVWQLLSFAEWIDLFDVEK